MASLEFRCKYDRELKKKKTFTCWTSDKAPYALVDYNLSSQIFQWCLMWMLWNCIVYQHHNDCC